MSVIAQLKKRNKFQVLKRQTEIKNMEVLIFTAASLLWPYSLWFSQLLFNDWVSLLSLYHSSVMPILQTEIPDFTRFLDCAQKLMRRRAHSWSVIPTGSQLPLATHPGVPLVHFHSPQQLLKTFSTLLAFPNPNDFSSLTLSMYLCLLFDRENRSHRKGNRPAPGHRTHRFLSQVHTSSLPCHLSYARGVSPPG